MVLRELRKQKNLTQRQVADYIGITESGYCLIEKGKRCPSPNVAIKLGRLLGFDWAKLFEKNEADKEEQA